MRSDSAGAVRVGAVSFLNARPLVRYLDRKKPPPIDLSLEVPSRLATLMDAGRIDVALLPSIEYFRARDYRIVPDVSLSADGNVESVRVFSKVPIDDIRLLALDVSSRTSAALVKILLKRRTGALPEFINCSPDTELGSVDADAMLLIGDSAMKFQRDDSVVTLDLGEAWKRLTGLPFVYAMWVARADIEPVGLHDRLAEARDEGLQRIEEIAAEGSRETGLSLAVCRNYLKNIMKYHLGEREIEALELFQELAAEDGLCPGGVPIAFNRF